jgi:ABC-type sugar transport system substrate-binding protein
MRCPKLLRFLALGVALPVMALTHAATHSALADAAHPTVGVVVPTFATEFWTNYVDFMKKGASDLGADLVVLNADNKSDAMIKSIEDLAARHVDGIIFTPYWSTAARGLTIAKDAGIPVILTDTYPAFQPQSSRFPNYVAFIGPSDAEAGYEMAQHLFAATPAGADGKKHIAVVNGTSGTSVAIDRRKGLERALKEHPEVVVAGEVDGDFVRDTAQTAFESLYQGHPEVRGVWPANGGMANGIMAALRNHGKVPGKDVMIVAMDLNHENMEPLKNGDLLFDIGGHWLQGGFALVMLYDTIKGHPVPEKQATVKLALLPLTKDRVAQYEKDFPGGLPAYDFKAHSQTYNPSAKVAYFDMKYSQ